MEKNTPPLISVAMATYNGEKFITRQIESILNQEYTNIELIICDDCSRDKTRQIIENYAKKDNRIRYTFHETNLGLIGNFDSALSRCKGEFVALADQDDIWERDKLQKLLELITDTKALLVYSNATLIDENDGVLPYDLWDERIRKYNLVDGNNYEPFYFNNCVTGCTTLLKSELLKDALPIPRSVRFHDWWLAYVAARIGHIAYTQEKLTRYRQHAGNVTGILREKKKKKNPFFQKKLEKISRLKRDNTKTRGFFKAIYAFEKKHGLETRMIEKLLEWERDYNGKLFLYGYKSFFEKNRHLFSMERSETDIDQRIAFLLHSRKKRLYEAYLGLIAPFAILLLLLGCILFY